MHVRKGPHAKKHRDSGAGVTCLSCEGCVNHEASLEKLLLVHEAESVAVRSKRGSVFLSQDSVLSLGGVCIGGVGKSTHGFALLAPPVRLNSSLSIVVQSAAKLHFVLSSSRRILDRRIQYSEKSAEPKWYLNPREFEKLFLTCGVDWMDRPQFDATYRQLDLNQSGALHLSELFAVCMGADAICREIINGQANLAALTAELRQCQSNGESLVNQLKSLRS